MHLAQNVRRRWITATSMGLNSTCHANTWNTTANAHRFVQNRDLNNMRLTATSHVSVAHSIPSSKPVSSQVVNNPSSRALLRILPHTCSLRGSEKLQVHKERLGKCRSSAGDDAAPPGPSIEEASKVLGVSPSDGFDTVLKAKNRWVRLRLRWVETNETN